MGRLSKRDHTALLNRKRYLEHENRWLKRGQMIGREKGRIASGRSLEEPPVVLVFYEERKRSPLFTYFYEALEKSTGNVKFHTHQGGFPEVALKDVAPDYVLRGCGFYDVRAIEERVNSDGIFFMTEIGDPHGFGAHMKTQMAGIRRITHLIRHAPIWEEWVWGAFKHGVEPFPNLLGAHDTYIPWGINPRYYRTTKGKKDIDVMCVFSYGAFHGFDVERGKLRTIVENLRLKTVTGNVYGRDYRKLLKRSKIVIALPSRNCLTQKFIEIPACGGLLLGRPPAGTDGLFDAGTSYVELPDDLHELPELISGLLEDDEMRTRIAKVGEERVVKKFPMKVAISAFENSILAHWNGLGGGL